MMGPAVHRRGQPERTGATTENGIGRVLPPEKTNQGPGLVSPKRTGSLEIRLERSANDSPCGERTRLRRQGGSAIALFAYDSKRQSVVPAPVLIHKRIAGRRKNTPLSTRLRICQQFFHKVSTTYIFLGESGLRRKRAIMSTSWFAGWNLPAPCGQEIHTYSQVANNREAGGRESGRSGFFSGSIVVLGHVCDGKMAPAPGGSGVLRHARSVARVSPTRGYRTIMIAPINVKVSPGDREGE